jgi:hypothetical protein
MLMWIYRRRGGWVALRQSFQQSAVSWTISNWIKIIQTGKHKYNIEVMSEQVLPVFPGGSKGCEPAHIHTHTRTHTRNRKSCNATTSATSGTTIFLLFVLLKNTS